jgi:hypothetical protein
MTLFADSLQPIFGYYLGSNSMSNSMIIRETRERLGLSVTEAATAVGVSIGHFRDLEDVDEDLGMTLSLAQFGCLCRLLGLPPHRVLGVPAPRRTVTPAELRTEVREVCRRKRWSLPQFSDHVGWAMQPLIEDPIEAVASWNLHCLQDVCAALEIDYIEAIPECGSPVAS